MSRGCSPRRRILGVMATKAPGGEHEQDSTLVGSGTRVVVSGGGGGVGAAVDGSAAAAGGGAGGGADRGAGCAVGPVVDGSASPRPAAVGAGVRGEGGVPRSDDGGVAGASGDGS